MSRTPTTAATRRSPSSRAESLSKRTLQLTTSCSDAVREILDLAGMRWAIPHTWRRYVATKMEKAGRAPSDIADQLGHVDASMTQSTYLDRDLMGRGDARVADAL
ncbi:tyrosine-type recombinase/integrase [Kribbella sp. NPDC056345]|uniref:tyrosine-type recombinase/integrase n=1 Tax=Kribbella sp. NPDC056345 TaxID=3345789 RepID=UPI0035E040FF